MPILSEYTFLIPALWAYMTVCFCIAFIRQRNDVADVAWGLGFLLVALLTGYRHGFSSQSGAIVDVLVAIWALRLAGHIYFRNRGKGEDYRYKAWRESWGRWFYVRSYFQIFILQGALLLIVAAPVVVAKSSVGAVSPLTIVGALVWLLGFVFETVGDLQLSRFIADSANKGKLLQSGLWAYTRHPNYFGEVTQWWGIWLIAFVLPWGLWSIIGPLAITFLILRVSGVPLLEHRMANNPEFEEYKKRVSVFIPFARR